LEQRLLPFTHPVAVNAELARQLVYRLLTFGRFKRHLELELGTEVLSFPWHPRTSTCLIIRVFITLARGPVLGANYTFTKNRNAGPAAIALGAILVAWIVIQVGIIRSINWMHILYFVLGLAELVLGMLVRRRHKKAA
jgi:hypothetical protein